jgi:hypothetical protein
VLEAVDELQCSDAVLVVIRPGRLPIAAYDLRVLVLCQEGYTSSLGAASLHRLA